MMFGPHLYIVPIVRLRKFFVLRKLGNSSNDSLIFPGKYVPENEGNSILEGMRFQTFSRIMPPDLPRFGPLHLLAILPAPLCKTKHLTLYYLSL